MMKKEKKKWEYKEINIIIPVIVISAIIGWIYEVIFYWMNSGFKTFYLRGICFGPWIDIYALGGLFIYLFCKRYKNSKLKVFLISGLSCGALELIAGLLIYYLFDGKRSWNYNTEILGFGNIDGFVCIRSVLIFATFGLFLIYVVVPFIKYLLESKYNKIFIIISNILISLFLIDEVYNLLCYFKIINMHGASYYYRKLGFKYMSYK